MAACEISGNRRRKDVCSVSLFPIPYDSRDDPHELTTTENSGKSRPGCLLGYQEADAYITQYEESEEFYNLLN